MADKLSKERMDGWYSALTGIGVGKWDKRTSSSFIPEVVTEEDARELWRGDDIAARVIETVPKEMFREGFTVKLETKELSEAVSDVIRRIQFNRAFKRAKKYERAYGGAAIFPVINDGEDSLEKPLNLERISDIKFFQVFEPRELYPMSYYTDPQSPKFGRPQVYRLVPIQSFGGLAPALVNIHESRMIIFDGIRVSRQVVPGTRPGWGDSVLTRMQNVLRDFNISWASAAILLNDFAQAVFKMKGLAELIATDRDDLVKLRMQAVELSRSTARAILIDADNEEFERKQTPLTGLPEMLDKFATRLAAAAQMPLTLLMGMSPGGLNATGESDIQLFYDSVAAEQEDTEPQVRYGVELILRMISGPLKGKVPESWSINWTPLWQPSQKETCDARFVQAQVDQIYINTGVVSAEEIALTRFGGNEYSYDTHIDFDARTKLIPAADSPVKTTQQQAEEDQQHQRKLEQLKARVPSQVDPTNPSADLESSEVAARKDNVIRMTD